MFCRKINHHLNVFKGYFFIYFSTIFYKKASFCFAKLGKLS